MKDKESKIYFVKTISDGKTQPILNENRLIENSNNNTETTIIIDTNILIRIEKIVKGGNTLRLVKQYNMVKVLSLLNKYGRHCPKSISAGIALMEMPPSKREYAHYCFDEFTKVHASELRDDFRGINEPPEYSEVTTLKFDELDEDQKAVYSHLYGNFLILLLANEQALSPEKKYKYYIDKVVNELDIISTQISEIAKLCFYNPTGEEENDFKSLFKAIKGNFLKKPSKYYGSKLSPSERIKQGALNSTSDLFITICATHSDANKLEGTKQDTWIATADGKLAVFIKYFSYSYLGALTGAITQTERYDDQTNSPYWQEVDQYSRELSNERRSRIFSPENKLDVAKLLAAVQTLHNEIDKKYK